MAVNWIKYVVENVDVMSSYEKQNHQGIRRRKNALTQNDKVQTGKL